MGQLSLPTATFPRSSRVPGPIPFSFYLLGHHGAEQIHSYLPAPQPGAGTLPPFQQEVCLLLLSLTEPSPPGTVGPASLMPTETQIPRGSWEGSRAWLWHRKKSRERRGDFCIPLLGTMLGWSHPVQARRQKGQDTLPPPNPKPCPPPPLLPLIVPCAHLHRKGILQRAAGARSSVPVAVPILATAAVSTRPSLGLLSRLRVWSKLDALKKLLCACARVCECVLIT